MIQSRHNKIHGGAAIFIVVFSALLMLVVTLSFAQLMIGDQRQATTADLSQSAYDSALAGVEDAKRAIIAADNCTSGASCSAMRSTLRTDSCDMVQRVLGGAAGDEQGVGTGAVAADLDQAYTCAKVVLNTDDYIKSVAANESVMVPLKGVSRFNQVRVSWFTLEDLEDSQIVSVTNETNALPVQGETTWPQSRPALLRTQLMQTDDQFTLDQFDDSDDGESNANTLFLYPSLAGTSSKDFALDSRRAGESSAGTPSPVKCITSLVAGQYACSTTINLPDPRSGSASSRDNAFLFLTMLYNKSNVKIELLNNSNIVQFDGVQPIADVTGRANDVFRRVQARLETGANTVYPQAALEVRNGLCKDFSVTDRSGDYNNNSGPLCYWQPATAAGATTP